MSATQSLTFGNLESATYGTAAVTQRRSRATNRSLYRQSLAFDEALLIERLKAGDSEALETIFNTYSKKLYKVVLRILGEAADTQKVIQDVFWTAFRKAQSFRGNSRFSKKNDLLLDGWIKEVAPSDRLRNWFGHDAKKWKEFRKQYFAELHAKATSWQPIIERARRCDVTLLYGARDSEHNNAVALKDF